MKFKREFKVGLLVVIAGVMFYMGFNFLKGEDFFSSSKKYLVIYDDIDGLNVSNPVIINGFSVGRVENIELLHDKTSKLLVTLSINGQVPIGDSSVALLANNGLLSGKAVLLDLGQSTRPLKEGEYMIGKVDLGLVEVIKSKAEPLIENLDITVKSINDLLDDKNRAHIDSMMVSFDESAKNMAVISKSFKNIMQKNSGALNQTMQNMAIISTSLNETTAELTPLMQKMNTFADSLNQLELKQTLQQTTDLLRNLEQITAKIDSGQGALGKLINDDELHINLNKTVNDLDSLFIDMKDRPSRYIHFSVFGKKDKDKDKKNK